MENHSENNNKCNILENFKAQFKKSTLPLMVLKILSEKDQMYACENSQGILRRTNRVYKMPLLYTTINKLQEQGVTKESEKVITETNRTRVYYHIAGSGMTHLKKLSDLYAQRNQAVWSIIYEKGERD